MHKSVRSSQPAITKPPLAADIQLEALYRAALTAVQPAGLIERHAVCDAPFWRYRNGQVSLDVELPNPSGRVFICGAGKAVAPFAHALAKSLGHHLDSGLVVTKTAHTPVGMDARIRVIEAAHPVPDATSEYAASEMLAFLGNTGPADLVFFLVTGGASALVAAPAKGVTLADKQSLTRQLLACGANIHEINTLRKHLSQLKGGQLLRHVQGARVVTLAISDVLGDAPATIGSGMTVADPTTFGECLAVLERYQLRHRCPPGVLAYLEQGAAGGAAETIKPGDPLLSRTRFHVLAGIDDAINAATRRAAGMGLDVHRLEPLLSGDIERCVYRLKQRIGELSVSTDRPWVLITGGEPEVVVRGSGKGGRNQQLALLFAIALQDALPVWALMAGTDGTDGPTDAAGAFITPDTLMRCRAAGLDAKAHATQCDAYPLFAALGDLFKPGPTGTNVMDLVLVRGGGFITNR
jgi:glycerate 2-kinase